MSDSLNLWRAVERTDPRRTKQFSGKGGFKGTAISPMYLIYRATELWGPMGGKWGVRILGSEVLDGPNDERLHVVQAEVFYPGGAVPCFGQTTLCGRRKDGTPYMDEEAPKKSLTDALTKGLSWLGFAADVHMGLFDDVKYVNRVKEEFEQEERDGEAAAQTELRQKALAILAEGSKKGLAELRAVWKTLSEEMRKTIAQTEWEPLKAQAQKVDASRGKEAVSA